MAMVKSKQLLRIAMFPWFAMGHITPYLQLSNELAQKGHKISFLLPNKAKLHIQKLNLHPDLIVLHPITVPPVDGLPLGTETASDVPLSLTVLLITAFDLTRDQVGALLKDLKPDLVFYDFAYWMPQLAVEIGFTTVCYHVVAAATIASGICTRSLPKDDGPNWVESFEHLPPGYPSSTVVLRPHEARLRWLRILSVKSGSGIIFQMRLRMGMENCDALAMRTCRELDGNMCEYIANHFGKPILLTGPVLPKVNSIMPLEKQWADWLDRFEPSSVVFCTFGSQWVLKKDQFQELVLGFELTGLPFVIDVKPPVGAARIEEALPEGYEERIRGRGVVMGVGWVQHPSILSHPSVGCFVSHGGSGSMWESLLSDNQIVLLPHLSDQILNARLLAKELKVAVEVERDENGWFSKESLREAIVSVMNKDGEVAGLVKKNHAKLKETLLSPGFLSGYMDEFNEKLQELL